MHRPIFLLEDDMDDNDFLNAFMNIDILKAEGVSVIVGRVIAKLRQGMVEGGMQPYEADGLITLAFQTLLNSLQQNQ